MLDKTYKSYFDKINPTNELIKKTQEKMKQEKTKMHFSFYRYGGLVAACLIIILFTFLVKAPNNRLQTDSIPNDSLSKSSDAIYFDSEITNEENTNAIPKPSNFFNSSEINSITSSMDYASSDTITAKTSISEPLWKTILLFPFRAIKALIDIVL